MRRVFRLLARAAIPREVDDELAFHIEMRTRRLIEEGLSPEAARAEALRQFGDVRAVRDDCVTLDHQRERTMRRITWFEEFRHDLRFAARTLRRNAGFSLVVILTLALGIGANTAIFTLVHAVMLRAIPVTDPGQLVTVGNPARVNSLSQGSPRSDLLSYPMYQDLRDRNTVFSGALASGRTGRLDVRLDSSTTIEHPRGRYVSANYFAVLGVPAFRGRVFDGTEDRAAGAASVAVISYGYWSRKFNRDDAVLGRTIRAGDASLTIIGVTGPEFSGEIVGRGNDIWLPVSMQPLIFPHQPMLTDRSISFLLMMGRLKPGATLEQAQAELDPLIRRQVSDNLDVGGQAALDVARRATVTIVPGARGFSSVRSVYSTPLLTLMAGVALLLLIICGNVANLLLARAVARSREMCVRLAIGAARARLVKQMLTESMLLASIGAAGGIALAWWGSKLLLTLAADGGSAFPLDVTPDLPVLGFTAALSIVAVIIFGLAPALRAANVDLSGAMRAHARSVSGSLGNRGQRAPLGKVLIVAQVALSLVLLVGAALEVRSLRHLEEADPGLARESLIVLDADTRQRGLMDERLLAFTRQALQRLSQIPGVTGVTYSENGIFSGTESGTSVNTPGFVAREANDTSAAYDVIGPNYVRTIGARLVRGRDFTEQDVRGSHNVALINERLAQRFFSGREALGGLLRFDDSTTAEVVGVVADVMDHELTEAPGPRFYVPALQGYLGFAGELKLIVRTAGDPVPLTQTVRREVQAMDGLLVIDAVDPLTVLMRASIRSERLVARLATGFGVLALLLAAIGLYGVMTYAISRRTGEIGLRVALGAQRGDVVRMVLREAFGQVGVGALIGLPLALGATRLLRTQLHGVGTVDPVAMGMAVGVLALSAAVAALLPALRAARVDPIVALQQD